MNPYLEMMIPHQSKVFRVRLICHQMEFVLKSRFYLEIIMNCRISSTLAVHPFDRSLVDYRIDLSLVVHQTVQSLAVHPSDLMDLLDHLKVLVISRSLPVRPISMSMDFTDHQRWMVVNRIVPFSVLDLMIKDPFGLLLLREC